MRESIARSATGCDPASYKNVEYRRPVINLFRSAQVEVIAEWTMVLE